MKIIYCCVVKNLMLTVYSDNRIVFTKEHKKDIPKELQRIETLTLMYDELPCVIELFQTAFDKYKEYLSTPPK